MKEKKHNLIYKITNLINEKIYIGRHSTNKIDDGYMGSGYELQKAFDKYGIENFKREILFDFNTVEEMIAKENELLTEDFVKRKDVYNIVAGGTSGMDGKTHTPEVRKIISETNIGFLTVKDQDGNTFRTSKDDPRYLIGELVHMFHGTVCVKDSQGNNFRIPINDERILNGELISSNSGVKQSPERIRNRVEKNLEWWKENSHSEQGLQKMRDVNKGKVNVRDKDGNVFRVSINDERYLNGELIVACKGNVWIHNDALEKSRFVNSEKVQSFLDQGWILGLVYYNNKKRVWISNLKLGISKQIKEEDLNNIEPGWDLGRILFKDVGEKIKAGKGPELG